MGTILTAESARELLRPLIQQARDEGKWLWCHYQNLWFSPDELAAQNEQGSYLWGPVNWKLRDPAEHIEQLKAALLSNARARADELRIAEQRVKESQ